ncbi:MAG: replication initiation protein [Saprospiraceae bacterium]|nr:replication initiation protein [Saprospiraceae bacterium]
MAHQSKSELKLQKLHELKVVKRNDLIENSGYRLPARAAFLLYYLISRLDSKNQREFEDVHMSFDDIQAILNCDGVRRISTKKEGFKIMKDLNSQPIHWWNKEEDEEEMLTWITGLKRKGDNFRFRFSPDLKGFLLGLNKQEGNFTQFLLFKRVFECSHSFRIFTILARNLGNRPTFKFVVDIEKLKFQLGITGKYQKFYEFKRWVMDPSTKEINVITDIGCKWEVSEKQGKTVVSILVKVWRKTSAQALPALVELPPSSDKQISDSDTQKPDTQISEIFVKLWDRMRDWEDITEAGLKNAISKYSDNQLLGALVQTEDQYHANPGSIISRGKYFYKLAQIPTLFDEVQQKKEVVREKKKKVENQNRVEADKKEKVAALQREKGDKIQALVDNIIASQPELLTVIIDQYKQSRPNIADKSRDEILKFPPFIGVLSSKILTQFPERFEEINRHYESELRVLNTRQ